MPFRNLRSLILHVYRQISRGLSSTSGRACRRRRRRGRSARARWTCPMRSSTSGTWRPERANWAGTHCVMNTRPHTTASFYNWFQFHVLNNAPIWKKRTRICPFPTTRTITTGHIFVKSTSVIWSIRDGNWVLGTFSTFTNQHFWNVCIISCFWTTRFKNAIFITDFATLNEQNLVHFNL